MSVNEQHIELIYQLTPKRFQEGLTDAEEASLQSAIGSSSEASELYSELKSTWEVMDDFKPMPTINIDVDNAWSNVAKNITSASVEVKPEAKVISMKSFWKPLSIAASIAVVFGLSWMFLGESSQTIVAFNDTNIEMEITLPDHSLVSLDPGAEVSYDESFGIESRYVEMKGNAWFEVKKDTKPFMIKTSLINIRVTGTSFYVADEIGKEVEVNVIEGQVVLVNQRKTDQVITLNKGETVLFKRESKEFEKIDKDLNNLYSRTKQLLFNRTPLKRVIKVLEKTYDRKIDLSVKNTKNCNYTGSFKEQSCEEVLEVLSLTLKLEVRDSSDVIILEGAGCE